MTEKMSKLTERVFDLLETQVFPPVEAPKIVFPLYDARVTGLAFLSTLDRRSHTVSQQASAGEKCFRTPYLILTILAFSGNVRDVTAFSGVNLLSRTVVHSERRLWRFCVRYDGVDLDRRGRFWGHITGADFLKAQAVEQKQNFEDFINIGKKGTWTEAIETDVKRTYGVIAPHKKSLDSRLCSVTNDPEKLAIRQEQLRNILLALAGRFPDIGYCQGMDYIVAYVLDVMSCHDQPEESTFWISVALFENYGMKLMFSAGLERLQLCCYQFQRFFQAFLPELNEHFITLKVVLEMFVVGWFQTLFVYLTVLPKATLDRLWDIFIFERDWKIMFRVALALLQLAEPHVVGHSLETTMHVLNTFPMEESLVPRELIHKALSIKVTNALLFQLRQEFQFSNPKSNVESFALKG